MSTLLIENGREIGGLAEQPKEWEYLGQTSGNAEIVIPDEATEVIAQCTVSSTTVQFQFATIQDDINVTRQGFYSGANNYMVAMFKWIKSTRKANLYSFNFAGTDYTSSATTKWYIKN